MYVKHNLKLQKWNFSEDLECSKDNNLEINNSEMKKLLKDPDETEYIFQVVNNINKEY